MGRRIAAERKKRGLSQKEFGSLVDRSETWVSQVERGVRKIDRMSVLERVAEVLDVPLAELAPDVPVAAVSPEKPEVVSDLALALTSSDALCAVLQRSQDVDVEKMVDSAILAWDYTHSSSYDQLGELLLEVLPDMERAARSTAGKDQKRLFASLAKSYHAAAAVLSKVGETSAAWVAADRAISAAERANDPLLMAEGAFRLTLVFQGARWFELARRTASTAAEALSSVQSKDNPAALSLWGALNLQLAVVAARIDEGDEAYERLQDAQDAAATLGKDRNDYDTEFGPTNVKLHEVAVAVELGDAGRAIRVGESLDASSLSAERQARLLIDLARAHTQRRNLDGAVSCLRRADQIAPQQVRSHALVRAVLADLTQSGFSDSPDLRQLVADLGLPI
ncbi:helix-turn-helix domain-containing protein [Longimycelium tulufanense]|nr:helix-turn-helix transcriptional regulator [Longimycelium tulufanense]